MATVYKVLAQAAPAATTESTLYTVPAGTSAVVSTIAIANQAGTSGTYRIVVRPSADASTTQKHYIVYGATVGANDSIMLTLGITLAAGDLIRVYASTANMSFNAFGSELS
jgi:hypothetical protein